MSTAYHFTADRFAPGIQAKGLSRGVLVVNDHPIQLDHSYRWLTVNPDWSQEWSEGTGRLPYKRNEVRFTFEIPEAESHRLLQWQSVGPLVCRIYDILSGFGDPQNWRLWRGDVPAEWITDVTRNPAAAKGGRGE